MLAEFAVLESRDPSRIPDKVALLLPADTAGDDQWIEVGSVEFNQVFPERLVVLLTAEALGRLEAEGGPLRDELTDLAEAVLLQARELDPTLTAQCVVQLFAESGQELLVFGPDA